MIKTILAGDLSLACPAFAVVTVDTETQKMEVIHLSHIKTNNKRSTGYRLRQIRDHLATNIYGKFDIDEAVIEKGFSRFPTATQQIQRTVGVVFYTIHSMYELDVAEIAVTTVKKAVTGKGKAEKSEVAEHLSKYIGDIKFANDDESDACAVAVAYAKEKKWI